MKMFTLTALAGLAVVTMAAIEDPCNPGPNDYPSGYDENVPGVDSWKFTWSDDTSNQMRTRACHSCERCTMEDMPPYDPDCQYPNGFRTAQVHMANEPPFCLTVGDAGNSMVQVLIETEEEDDRLCIESTGSQIALNNGVTMPAQCGEGQINACFPGEDSGNLKLMVYCDHSCPESPIVFKYKVMHSQSRANYNQEDAAVQNVDMWCMMQDGTAQVRWPSEMLPDEPEILQEMLPPSPNASTSLHSGCVWLFASLAGVLALFR